MANLYLNKAMQATMAPAAGVSAAIRPRSWSEGKEGSERRLFLSGRGSSSDSDSNSDLTEETDFESECRVGYTKKAARREACRNFDIESFEEELLSKGSSNATSLHVLQHSLIKLIIPSRRRKE